MLFTVPSTGRFYRKPFLSLVLKILTKNPREKKTGVYCHFVEQKNKGRKPDK
jgi:hypothetical protein